MGIAYLDSLPRTIKFPSTEGSIHYGDTLVYSTHIGGETPGEVAYTMAGTVTCDAQQNCGISGGLGEGFSADPGDPWWTGSGMVSDLLFNISGKGETLIPMEEEKGNFLKISCE